MARMNMDACLAHNSEFVSKALGVGFDTFVEEQNHTWAPCVTQCFSEPLLRTYDAKSGSQPDPSTGAMRARALLQYLDSFQLRQNFLKTHLNHGNWTDTPGISFMTSPVALAQLANLRANKPKRGPQMIVAVNPNVRVAKGSPIINAATEMARYDVRSPYAVDYWDDHYICLWFINANEVVGRWNWDELKAQSSWYDRVIMPAFKAHTRLYTPAKMAKDEDDLAALMRDLGIDCSHQSPRDGSGTDSDDEVEEANASDDYMNSI